MSNNNKMNNTNENTENTENLDSNRENTPNINIVEANTNIQEENIPNINIVNEEVPLNNINPQNVFFSTFTTNTIDDMGTLFATQFYNSIQQILNTQDINNNAIINDDHEDEDEEEEQNYSNEDQEDEEHEEHEEEQPNNIIHEIHPANARTFNLLNMFVPMIQQAPPEEIEAKTNELIAKGYELTDKFNEPVNDYINNFLLHSYQYGDIESDLVYYTIRSCFQYGREHFQLIEVIGGILYYANNNIIFNNQYDLVLKYLRNEVRRVVTANLNIHRFNIVINPQNTLEDIKLVVKEDILDKIPTMEFEKLDTKIKEANNKCVICQDEFDIHDNVRVLPCDHIYHINCIDSWLKEHSYKCPCCRKPAAEHSAKI